MTPEEMLSLPEGTICKIVSNTVESDEDWEVGELVVRTVKGVFDDEASASFCSVDDSNKWDYFNPEEVEVYYGDVSVLSSADGIITQEPKSHVELFFEPAEYTGGSSSYYTVKVENPTTEGVEPYVVECNDIIEALGMSFAEGNAFKAIWRSCAARLGKVKKGYTDGQYDAEKVIFFGERMLAKALYEKAKG